jgi:hypothetical protein
LASAFCAFAAAAALALAVGGFFPPFPRGTKPFRSSLEAACVTEEQGVSMRKQ